jgi:hypothetical protein
MKGTALNATALVLQDGTIVSLSTERGEIAGSFYRILKLLWKEKLLLAVGLGIGIAVGIFSAWTWPHKYVARVIVEPGPVADSLNQGGLLSSLGSSLSPFGAQLPQMEKDFLQLLQSNAVAENLLKDRSITTRVFANEWDVEGKIWRAPRTPYALFVQASHLMLGQPAWVAPNVSRMKLFLEQNLIISPIGDGSLQQISISTRNPQMSADILKAAINAADNYLRAREATRAHASIRYWQSQLDRTSSQDLRNALIAAIVDSQRRAVFADVDLPFSIDVTDPVIVPDTPSAPGIFLVLSGALLGLLIGAGVAIYRAFISPLRHPAQARS